MDKRLWFVGVNTTCTRLCRVRFPGSPLDGPLSGFLPLRTKRWECAFGATDSQRAPAPVLFLVIASSG
jgi:hypothetical protein